MNSEIDFLFNKREKIFNFLKGLKGESFIKAFDCIKDDVLVDEIKEELVCQMKEEGNYETAKREFLKFDDEKQEDAKNTILDITQAILMPYQEKIVLLSESKIKKALELNTKLEKMYSKSGFVLQLMKDQKIDTRLREKFSDVKKVLNVELVKTDIAFEISCNLLGFYDYTNELLNDIDVYKFILQSIKKLNENQAYFEFIFEKN